MRSVDGLFDEFAAALQFPYYFGENWAAFDECLGEIDWLEPTSGLIVLITEAGQVLADCPADELGRLVRSIERAHETYSAPIAAGEWWDRPALPFHVVLQRSAGDDRWARAGATPAPLP